MGRTDFFLLEIATLFNALPLVLMLLRVSLAEERPLVVGNRKKLFIDHRYIAKSERVILRTNPGQKLGQILDPGGEPLMGYVSMVIEDQGIIRMYVGHDGVAIYESNDGLHFKPTGRSIGGGIFSTIFLDPHDLNPAHRFKLFLLKTKSTFDPSTDGVYAFTSANGLDFKEVGRMLPYFTDNPTIFQFLAE